jgi:hypothetical protein
MYRVSDISISGVAGAITLFALQAALADDRAANDPAAQIKDRARMNCGAQIECVTPDGHAGQVSRVPVQEPTATALIMDDDTVTCLLPEGETNFVIELPQTALPERFTFLNENARARGELRIAVSNHRLAAKSPEWTEVEGIIPFAHKRLFGVSLLGIEAKFVRLSFHVEKAGRIAALAVYGSKLLSAATDRYDENAQPFKVFEASGLEDALDSKFARLHSSGSTLLLTSNSPSVAPLPQMARD